MFRRMTSSPRRSTRNMVSSFGSKSVTTAAAPQSRTASRSSSRSRSHSPVIACAVRGNHIHLATDQVSYQRRKTIILAVRPAEFNRHILALDIPVPFRPSRNARARYANRSGDLLLRNPITGIDAAARIRPAERRDRFGDRALGHELPSCRLAAPLALAHGVLDRDAVDPLAAGLLGHERAWFRRSWPTAPLPVWRRDDGQGAFALRITPHGLADPLG